MISTRPSQLFVCLSNCVRVFIFVFLLAISIDLVGCGGRNQVRVSVFSSNSNVLLGNTLQFTATVTGTSDKTVTWSVNGINGGNTTPGTISASGLYTAPADLPNPPAISVTATSRVHPRASGSVTVTVTSDIIVKLETIPPNTSSLQAGSSVQLNETISSGGHPDLGVIWSVNGMVNGGPGVGTISSSGQSGIYTAPPAVPSPPTVTIQTTSKADRTMSASVLLTVAPSVQVSVSPAFTSVFLGNTQLYTATVTGSANTAVTWAVEGVMGGNPTVGTISSSGLYTAPADLPNPPTVTITATSQADSSKSGNASANLASDITITIATTPSNQQPFPYGATVQLTATISSPGRPDPTVSWLVNGVANGGPSVGTIAVTGADTATYTAPQSYAHPNPVQIVAQSVADSSKEGETQLTVFADVVLAGAGDIADCINLDPARQTEDLLDGIPGTVFAVGDLAYPHGSDGDFASCYDPTWGGQKSRTRPVLGNHEYETPNAQGYFDYWGSMLTGTAADPTKGYYSYDLGAWHVIVINSNCNHLPAGTGMDGCDTGSPQQQWLRDDLAAHRGVCTIAFWHHPYFVPVEAAPTDFPRFKAIWQTLFDADVHVVVNGHLHDYQRWARQDPDGNATSVGIRQFIIGTGGSNNPDLHCLAGTPGCPNPPKTLPYSGANLEALGNGLNYGVLIMTLHQDSYDWLHIFVGGQGDSGTESCH